MPAEESMHRLLRTRLTRSDFRTPAYRKDRRPKSFIQRFTQESQSWV